MVLFEITYFIRNIFHQITPEISVENIEAKQYIIASQFRMSLTQL